MVNFYSEYFDKFVKESGRNIDNIYFSSSIEHEKNVEKVFQLMSDNPEAIVLDAGCGVGNFIIPLSYKCKFIYGIDFSKESIILCKKRLLNRNINNAFVQVSSITKVPFKNKSVDKILCFSVFQYLDFEEITVVIKEFKRILKKDGLIVIGFLNGASPHGISTQVFRFVRRIIKGKKKYSSTNIPFTQLKKIIDNENGSIKIIHSAYFYPILFPKTIINFISNRFYYEKYLPEFLKKYGLSLLIRVQFK